MLTAVRRWLARKWQPPDTAQLLQDHLEVFGSPAGRRLLSHWLDRVYCTVYEGTDPRQATLHEGRRSFVQELLENLDHAETPDKYRPREEETP